MRILVLVDGSKWSQKAALHAFSVAKKKGAKVVLFSVLDRKEAQAIAVSLAMRSGDVEKLKKFEETAWKEMKKGIHDVISALLELGQRRVSTAPSGLSKETPARKSLRRQTAGSTPLS